MNGEGVSQEEREAARYIRIAADQGDSKFGRHG